MRVILSVLAILWISVSVHAQSGVLGSEMPSSDLRRESSLSHRALGSTCAVIDPSPIFIPCNPSLLSFAKSDDASFSARIFFGNEYKQFQTVHQLLQGPHTPSFVEALFEKNQVIEAEASGDLIFRSNWFAASFTPYRLMYFSVVRNKAYPIIALRAVQERIFRVQVSHAVSEELSLGLQGRLVNREFIQNEFTLFDAATDPSAVLQKKTQNVFYLEPGLTYQGSTAWHPRWTALLTNIGVTDHPQDETKLFPKLDFGFGVQPPVGLGQLDFALNYRAANTLRSAGNQFDFGASYAVGLIQGIVGWNPDHSHLGLITRFWSAQVGIVYSAEKIELPDDQLDYHDSIFTEFALTF